MVDFHTHILPGIDDGSKHLADSLEMLRIEHQMGIDTAVLTPHFYSDQNSPEKFLERRQASWERLCGALESDMPQLLLGAEVQYFESMGNVEHLDSLCVQGTNLLLLEMPFSRWDDRTVRTVLELNTYSGLRLVLAHIERYMKDQPTAVWNQFREAGILMQVNASFFRGWLSRHKAMSMLQKNQFQLIGSDCHNLTTRRPNWDLVPKEAIQKVDETSKDLLRQAIHL